MNTLLLVTVLAAPRRSPDLREGCRVADRILQESPADATDTYLEYLSALDGEADGVADRRASRAALPGALLPLPEIHDRTGAGVVGAGLLAITGVAVGSAVHDHHVTHAIPGREEQARGALETVYQGVGAPWTDLLPMLYEARPTDEYWREELGARSEQAESAFEDSIFGHVGEAPHPSQDPPPVVWIRTQDDGMQDVEVGLHVRVSLVGGAGLGGTITAASEQEIVLDGQRTIPVADIASVRWTP